MEALAGFGAGDRRLAGGPDLIALDVGLAGEHAGVHQLDGGHRAVLGDGVRDGGEGGDTLVGIQREVLGDIHAVLGVYIGLAHMDDRRAAAGLGLVVGHERLGGDVLAGQVAVAGRGGKNTVAEDGVAQLEGLEQIGVFAGIHVKSSLLF